jgi:Tfp pilus assembly protein PilE
MKKGLSLVELLMTLSLALIMGTIIYGTYNKLRSRSTTIVQNRDQMVLKQVMETFHVMGGSVAKITADSTVSMEAKALALTNLLQNNGGSSSQSRVLKGVVGAGISSDMVVVAYAPNVGADDGRVRLVIDNSTGNLMAATTGAGFVVVSKSQNSSMVPSAASNASNQPAANALISAVNSDLNTVKGMHYADSNAYVWNEDTTIVNGPGSGTIASSGPTGPTGPLASLVIDPPIFSGAPFSVGGGVANYSSWEYQSDPTVSFFVHRSDNQPLSVGEVNISLNASSNGATWTPNYNTQSPSGSVPGVVIQVNGFLAKSSFSNTYVVGQSDITHVINVTVSRTSSPSIVATPVASSATLNAIHPVKIIASINKGNGILSGNTLSYTYDQYTTGAPVLSLARDDGKPILPSYISSATYSIGTQSGSLVSVPSVNVGAIWPVTSWGASSYSLSANVTLSSNNVDANGSIIGAQGGSWTIAAIQTPMGVNIGGPSVLASTNDAITVSVSGAPANWMSVSGNIDWAGTGASASMPTYISPLAQNGLNGVFSANGSGLATSMSMSMNRTSTSL